ncbi:MAG: oligosaccharide flippase family protein [Bacteroidales bacterium]
MSSRENENSYQSILETTGLIGLVQIIGVALGIIRTKAIALILGTQGFGVLSLYNGMVDFASSTSQFGIGVGSVKELSKAQSEDKQQAIREILYAIRFWIVMASSLAGLIIVVFAPQIGTYQFGAQGAEHIDGIRMLAFAVLFGNIYQIQISILNGVRQLRQMAYSQVLASVGGVFLALPVIYYGGKSGIELSILVVALFNAVTSYWFIRRVGYRSLRVDWTTLKRHLREILKVGLSFAIPSILGVSLAYGSRFFLKEQFSFAMLGIYQACVVLSTLYVQTILSAMGADFLPRLMAVHTDNAMVNRKVNEQMELGILMASIGVFATFILAPYLLQLFYSAQFVSGTTILRWQILAVFLRVLEWPMGFATTAKGKNVLFMTLQSAYLLFELGVLFLLSIWFGVDGLAVSYFISYSIFFVVRYYTMRVITGFRFSSLLLSIIKIVLFTLGIIIAAITMLPTYIGVSIALTALLVYTFWCNRVLKQNMEIDLWAKLTSVFNSRKDK